MQIYNFNQPYAHMDNLIFFNISDYRYLANSPDQSAYINAYIYKGRHKLGHVQSTKADAVKAAEQENLRPVYRIRIKLREGGLPALNKWIDEAVERRYGKR